jgi:hypothetical protein
MTAPTTPATETVARTLATNPDGITVRGLADKAGVSPATVSKTLTAMEADGTARREPGPANGNRRPADVWYPITPATDGEAAVPAPADDAPADTTPAPADGSATVTAAAPVSAAPVVSRQDYMRVLIMAGVLGGHEDGITADAAIGESGLSVVTGDAILAAMEVAGAARRLPVTEDGTELWVAVADADLTIVDPANAPTTTTCPTCGHVRKIRRPSATRRPAGATGTGRPTGEINSDGSTKLAKGELELMVETFIRDLGPGHDLTPGTVGRELGGRSSGACGNAMSKLSGKGILIMTSEAPVKYALSPTAPAPTGEVVAYMARRDAATHAPATPDNTADAGAGDNAPTSTPADTTPADEVTDGTPNEADRPAADEAAALVAA